MPITTGEPLPRNERPSRFASRASTRTHFLRVPRKEWAEVFHGEKTEIRWTRAGGPSRRALDLPTPIVGFSNASTFGGRDFRHGLLVLEDAWREPLGSISPESLAREGFEHLDEFRRYWTGRHHGGRWNPLVKIGVFRVRPWRGEEDESYFGALLLERLYLKVVRDGPTP